MKKFFAVPAAALLLAACSESTAPVKNPDLAIRAVTMTGCDTGEDCMDFNSSITATAGASFNSSTTTAAPAAPSDRFLGQFTNQAVSLFVPGISNSAQIEFDLYVIGTWDGNGGHKYGPDTWSVTATCDGSQVTSQTYSFSNKKTGIQSYPAQLGVDENKGLTGATVVGALGFGTSDGQRTTNHTVSSYDAVYHFSGVAAACSGGDVVYTFSSPSNQLQPAYDESWGLDNVVVTRN